MFYYSFKIFLSCQQPYHRVAFPQTFACISVRFQDVRDCRYLWLEILWRLRSVIFSNKIPLVLTVYHKNPQINRDTSLLFTCFTSLFFFFSRRSFSSRSLLDNTDELRHCTRLVSASGSGCFSSTISYYVKYIPSKEKCRPWHLMEMWKKNHDSKLER